MEIKQISAVTLAAADMSRSVEFYQKLGFELFYGGAETGFSSLRAGDAVVNLATREGYQGRCWGRVIFRVEDVDAQYRLASEAGLTPEDSPSNAQWGERFFHITDPDGHELSFAALLKAGAARGSSSAE